MTPLEQRAKELSARVAAFGGAPVKKKVKKAYSHPSFAYKSLGSRPAPWLPKKTVAQKATKGSVRSPFQYESLKIKDGNDGKTPVKGIDYFTTNELEAMKKEIASMIPQQELPEVDIEFVKKIVQIMHSLPENDKLEVSKGIRNAQSFIYGGTKYKTSELMHGGSSSGTVTGLNPQTPVGTVDSSNTTFTCTGIVTVAIADSVIDVDAVITGTTNSTIVYSIPPQNNVYAF